MAQEQSHQEHSPQDPHTAARIARAALSRVIEPGDLLGSLVVDQLGPERAWALINSAEVVTDRLQQQIGESAEQAGLSSRRRRVDQGLTRWRTRLSQADSARLLDSAARFNMGLLIPEDPAWPAMLRDLGAAAPLGLWFRATSGDQDPYAVVAERIPAGHRSIAVVGSREISDYGSRVTTELSEDFVRHGITVISGGAYGVDGAAHRGALASATSGASVPTIAVLASGVDRLYPAGHEPLLSRIAESGLLLSELPPGSTPSKHRFLHRNRIIAALAAATVVVEARWRSGALSTAHHALTVGRPLAVVPGSVYSATSAGCHRLFQETPAQLVTDAADVVGLIASQQPWDAAEPAGEAPASRDAQRLSGTGVQSALDVLGDVDRRVYDALPQRTLTTAGKLCEVAGLPLPGILSSLTRLERAGLARTVNHQWGRGIV